MIFLLTEFFVYIEIHNSQEKGEQNKVNMLKAMEDLKLLFDSWDCFLFYLRVLSFSLINNLIGTGIFVQINKNNTFLLFCFVFSETFTICFYIG